MRRISWSYWNGLFVLRVFGHGVQVYKTNSMAGLHHFNHIYFAFGYRFIFW